jgi:hypothetical protein
MPKVFTKGTILNRSAKAIAAYQIGWLYAYANRGPQVATSAWVSVVDDIKAGDSRAISGLPAPTVANTTGARAVIFYVAAVKYEDGATWHQDMTSVRKLAVRVREATGSGSGSASSF